MNISNKLIGTRYGEKIETIDGFLSGQTGLVADIVLSAGKIIGMELSPDNYYCDKNRRSVMISKDQVFFNPSYGKEGFLIRSSGFRNIPSDTPDSNQYLDAARDVYIGLLSVADISKVQNLAIQRVHYIYGTDQGLLITCPKPDDDERPMKKNIAFYVNFRDGVSPRSDLDGEKPIFHETVTAYTSVFKAAAFLITPQKSLHKFADSALDNLEIGFELSQVYKAVGPMYRR